MKQVIIIRAYFIIDVGNSAICFHSSTCSICLRCANVEDRSNFRQYTIRKSKNVNGRRYLTKFNYANLLNITYVCIYRIFELAAPQ